MIVDLLGSLLAFALLSFAPGWPIAARLPCSAPEKLLASAVLSLLAVFGVGWVVYVGALPHAAFWLLALGAALAAAASWRSLREAWRDREVRELAAAQWIVTAWCVSWLALVVTYSGGSWVGDWFGHWQRAAFFLNRGPHDVLFNGFDPLASRPPLANVVFGVFLVITRADFAHYQLASTFLASLAFLPMALLARRL